MSNYLLLLCLQHTFNSIYIIYIKLLFVYAVTGYIGKLGNDLLFINDYFRNLPFVTLLLLRSGDVETNTGPKIVLKIISNWAIQWKILFNPDPNKQAAEILFSKNHEKDNYPPLNFNGDNVQTAISQKHLGLVFDSKLDFN